MNQDLEQVCSRLYTANKDDLYIYILRSVRDESSSMDILQDAFCNFYRVFQKKDLPPNDTECRMYLFKIARNLLINQSRTAYSRKVDLVESYETTSLNQTSNTTPEDQVLNRMEREEAELLLQSILRELPEKERSILNLRYQANLKLEEIARIMEISISTASRLLKKAEHSLEYKGRQNGVSFADSV